MKKLLLMLLSLLVASVEFGNALFGISLYLFGNACVSEYGGEKFSFSHHSCFLLSPFGEFGSLDYINIIAHRLAFVKGFFEFSSKIFVEL